ncbi:MAG TPA: hypothetical protein VFP87_12430 [Chitinophagaceae bacterium]|nr:hypothetical protein [Chitinophagaceae bacterium]
METHAQEFHKAPGHGWTHYLFEFLMLFLAVFCGFLAENLREFSAERRKEKEYVLSMIDDLKRDTANFRSQLNLSQRALTSADTLINLLRPILKKNETSAMYYHARVLTISISPFEIFDRTYSQMKSSGNLTLFKSKKIADSVTAYYYDQTRLANQQSFISNLILAYMQNVSAVFHGYVFQQMAYARGLGPYYNAPAATKTVFDIPRPEGNPPLADESPRSIDMLEGSVHYLYSRILSARTIIRSESERATRLIKFLTKSYRLKGNL